MKEKFGKLWAEIRKGNYDYILHAFASRLPTRLFSYYHCVLVVSEKIDLPAVEQPDYFRKFVTPEDLDKLEKFGIPKELATKRLRSGYRAVIVGQGEEVASIVWGAPGSKKYPGEDGFMLYQAFTKEEYRNRRLVYIAYQMLYDRYAAEGKYKAYGTINRLNELSFKVHRRFNFKNVGSFVYIILFGLGICLFGKWPFPTRRIQFFLKKPPDNEKLWFLP